MSINDQNSPDNVDEELPEELPEEQSENLAEEAGGEMAEENLAKDLADLETQNDAVDPTDVADEAKTEGEDTQDDVPPTYEELESEIAALKDQLLRTLADGENLRRRTEREKTDMSKYAITSFARQIVSVADNLTRALESVAEEARNGDEELNNLYVGIEMTEKELQNSFEQFHIKVVDSIGQKFDHNLHQAMFEVEDLSQPSGLVVQEMQKGYVLHDRLLRPAMVGVSKGGPKMEDVDEAESSTQSPVEPPKEKAANDISSAYEKQAEAADQEAEGGSSKIDTEL
ncbi:MAG: nucleotide exchange factor GrpE [Rhodospirillales bacterium]|jgi:molecular chaperone GrpE|nr:nucleotide exchange factor GrpE [Rhodospirillales bacterium]|tara:strand:+ start:1401 stop:2258 length:858 start_codon:yes stop_codon:yes gene_type:complete